MSEATDTLDELIGRLEGAAEQLRSGDLSTDAAAMLVEECAVLANRAGAELEQRMRSGGQLGEGGSRAGEDQAEIDQHLPAPGQDSLL
jgi:hypothetical protein